MKPITQLYRIVEGALKDDISMVMCYAKRLMRNNSMDIDWGETEKGIQEILNAYNNRPANIATLDDDNSITITSTILKSDTPDSNEQTIDEEIKGQAHWLANNFSTRNGYTSMEENLIKMGEFVKNRMLDKYNLKNE